MTNGIPSNGHNKFRSFWTTAALALVSLGKPCRAAVDPIRFNEQIRPILSNQCFQCHGPDDKKRKASLRLDTFAGATEDLGGYAAIVPGKPEESELLHRMLSHDPDDVMPPPAAKKPPLSPQDLAVLRQWITEGAPYEAHWAFLPVKAPNPPPLPPGETAHNPIDHFIRDSLRKANLPPSPEADKTTLIRRVALDVTGLLPTPAEVADFLNDTQPGAYERMMEKFLASPHYGERWGRHWLDQARYADSNGYSVDSERTMWPYRDWVIRAINDDMPFDQFTIEQIAGDLLPSPTKSQLVATAFHRNTLINEEGGTKPEQFRNEAVVDRVNTTGAVWLGLTLACAQCHTHKFDPLTHTDYFRMFAFFNHGTDVNNAGATVAVAPGEMFGTNTPPPAAAPTENPRLAWEASLLEQSKAAAVPTWIPARYLDFDTTSGAGLRLAEANSLISDGSGAFNDTYRIVASFEGKAIQTIRLQALTHDSLPQKGPGLASNGNFVLTEIEVSQNGKPLEILSASGDHEQPGYPVTAAVDGDPKTGWAINIGKGSTAKMNADHEVRLILKNPALSSAGPLEIRLRHDVNESYLLGRFALSFAEGSHHFPKTFPDALLAALRTPAASRSKEQNALLDKEFARNTPEQIAPAQTGQARVMVMQDLPQPRTTFIHIRGDFLRPDEETGPLTPGVPEAIATAMGGPPRQFRNRLDLAKWLVDPAHPLTPRVTMNRVWMRYFGKGLVETEEDFGSQGSPPSHPALLDWLAAEFIKSGWSMKHMHRLILTSATYRQSSFHRPALEEKDPLNLLLSRQNRIRVEAEILRDAALSASGLLHPVLGGPGVKPPQPDGVYSFTQNKKNWKADTGPNRYRRAMYTTFYRSAPHPLFTTFDAPDFQTTCTRRARSNTPLQALSLANDIAFLEFAKALAARAMQETKSPETAPARAFELALSRPPNAAESAVLTAYFQKQKASLAADPAAIKELLPATWPPGVPAENGAALTCVARVILNSDAFVSRE